MNFAKSAGHQHVINFNIKRFVVNKLHFDFLKNN